MLEHRQAALRAACTLANALAKPKRPLNANEDTPFADTMVGSGAR